MSAAEKLRALDRAATKAPWILQDDWTDYGGVDMGPEGAGWIDPHGGYSAHRPDNELMVALRNALPQIVAVVEALQFIAEAKPVDDSAVSYQRSFERVRGEARDALAALNDALSPPTGGSP